MIAQPEALRIVRRQIFDWGTTSVPLSRALGRILSEDIRADRPQPPFDRVTMDGICIDYRSYANGQRYFPRARLQAAGDVPEPLADPTNCIEIMTGAALPPGVSTVIRYEDLEATEAGFHLPEQGVLDKKNIHWAGSDLADCEQVIIPAGRRVGVAEIGMLATFGYDAVKVSRLPRVAIISTGNELVAVSEKQPLPHQIRRSNVHQLASLLQQNGIEAERHHLPDEPQQMTVAIRELLKKQDVLIFSGGVSKGKLDHLPGVLAELDVEKLFHGVAQRPGKPLWVGRTDRCMVFGLPGNPVSSLACSKIYVSTFIARNLSLESSESQSLALGEDHTFRPDLHLALSVRLAPDPDGGEVKAYPVSHQGSGDATSMLRTDGFLLLPRGQKLFPAGGRFPYLPLNQLF
jgi:molybdopterin molybdotransferase